MEISAELGDASRFSEYDPDTNNYLIDGDLLQKSDVGSYLIRLKARFFNETYEEVYRGHFIVTIWKDAEVFDPWIPPDPIEYRVWE